MHTFSTPERRLGWCLWAISLVGINALLWTITQ